MTDCQSIMILLLRLAIMGDAAENKDINTAADRIKRMGAGFDWLEFLKECSSQTVLGLVWGVIEKYPALSSLLPFDYKLEWFGQNRKIVEQNKVINNTICSIVKALDEAGINSILLKGQGCASFYSNPMYRFSGDIDLFVGEDNFYKSHECLKKAGLVGDWIHEDVMHGMLSCDDVALEIHKYPAFLASEKADNAFQEEVKKYLLQSYSDCQRIKINGIDVSLMPLELNTVFTFIHMFKHFVGSGIKLRQVMDWLLMCKHVKNEQLVAQYVKTFGMENGWKVFAQMAVEQIGIPANQVPLYEANYCNKAVKVLHTLLNGDVLELATEENPSWGKKIKAVARLYFAHFHCFSIFPKESLQFLWVLVKMNAEKYLLRGRK